MNQQRGFIALVVVMMIAVLVLAAGVALPDISTRINNRSEDESRERMDMLHKGILAYARDYLVVPSTLDDLGRSDSSALWQGPYIEEVVQGWAGTSADYRTDAWGRNFQWKRDSRYRGLLASPGVDGVIGSKDDLQLSVDISILLQEITLARVLAINTAIGHYPNATAPPLQSPASQVVAQLQAQGLLSVGPIWDRDAYGDTLLTSGVPVQSLRSIHIEGAGR